ncbi:MAG: hypothetical protein JSV50_07525 [Desulfobacteraceae bacterium]|nr:MAG: hypothetical protein JSV50_07525 [Desulfobacteraceae bacterium]
MTIDLDKLSEQEIKNMTSDELNEAIERILRDMSRDTQLRVLNAIMKYTNISDLDLEKILEWELDL